MTTQLHIMADEPGEYTGRAAEINGKGFADMTFLAKSTSQEDFEEWVEVVKTIASQTHRCCIMTNLLKPSMNNPITLYS